MKWGKMTRADLNFIRSQGFRRTRGIWDAGYPKCNFWVGPTGRLYRYDWEAYRAVLRKSKRKGGGHG